LSYHPTVYLQICRRKVNELDISTKRSDDDGNDDDGNIVIAVDNTCIKVTNTGQWMYDKWVRKKEEEEAI
jgi:hypothetical protein